MLIVTPDKAVLRALWLMHLQDESVMDFSPREVSTFLDELPDASSGDHDSEDTWDNLVELESMGLVEEHESLMYRLSQTGSFLAAHQLRFAHEEETSQST